MGENVALMEIILVISGLALAASGALIASKRLDATTLLWSLGGVVFAIVSILLAVGGTKVLELKYSSFVGSIYPASLALAVASARMRWWKYVAAAYIILLAGILAGITFNLEALKGASHGLLHGTAGLILVALPAYYYYKYKTSPWVLAASLGGLTISVGGVALALAAGGVEWATQLVSVALYPVLILSALLLAAGFYASEGFRR